MLKKIMINGNIALFMMMITLLILDYFNPLMGFLRRPISIIFIGAFILFFAGNIIMSANYFFRKKKREIYTALKGEYISH